MEFISPRQSAKLTNVFMLFLLCMPHIPSPQKTLAAYSSNPFIPFVEHSLLPSAEQLIGINILRVFNRVNILLNIRDSLKHTSEFYVTCIANVAQLVENTISDQTFGTPKRLLNLSVAAFELKITFPIVCKFNCGWDFFNSETWFCVFCQHWDEVRWLWVWIQIYFNHQVLLITT